MPIADEQRLEDTEVRLLLDGLFHGFGCDFRGYADEHLKRRVWERVHAEGVDTISQLQDKIFHEAGCLEALLAGLSNRRTALFEDPECFAVFRRTVVPVLRTYPSIQVWQPSCAGGEEVYALAIVLYEAGLLPRVRLYATDIHKAVYQPAERGVFPLGTMAASAANYEHAGGTSALAEYYTAEGDQAIMKPWLREQIVFSEHSLAADEGFNAFQLILCRHTWDLYNPSLQDRVITLFERSLCRFGMLGVGRLRVPQAVTDATRFQEIGSGWYRKQSKRMDVHG